MAGIGPNTRWVVDCFLRELDGVKLNEPEWPAHVAERRMKLAAMVYAEVPNDDPECFALRGLAMAVLDLCRWPADVATVSQYLSARSVHRDVLQAAYDAG
jgi:hypothetical protein